MAEGIEELKSLLMKVKEESEKVSLKLNIEKTKIMASSLIQFSSVQFISVQSLSRVQLFATPWATARQAFPVHHQLPELAQSHVHRVGDAIQPSHPLLSPSPPAFNLSKHQGLFQGVSSFCQLAKVLELQLQHQSFKCIFRTDYF